MPKMSRVMRVENARSFLDGYEEYFKQYNEIIKGEERDDPADGSRKDRGRPFGF
jgi:hypothetical protein